MFVIPVRLSLQKKLQIPRFAPFVPQGKRDDSVKTKQKPEAKEPARRRRYENRVQKLAAKT